MINGDPTETFKFGFHPFFLLDKLHGLCPRHWCSGSGRQDTFVSIMSCLTWSNNNLVSSIRKPRQNDNVRCRRCRFSAQPHNLQTASTNEKLGLVFFTSTGRGSEISQPTQSTLEWLVVQNSK